MNARQSVARRFGIHAATYVVANALTRGLWLLLTPFYTRVMAPGDYAVVSVANTVNSVIGITASLALYGAIPRLYIEREQHGRRVFLATISVFTVAFSVAVGGLLELLGHGGLLDLFPELPFRPHFELVIWSAVLSNWLNLPTQVYVALEKPRHVAALNVVAAVAQLLCAIVFVGVLRQGALGLLRGSLVAASLTGGLAVALLIRMSARKLSRSDLIAALVFALPLIPHLLANWALAVSDRLVLARFVSSADLGCYSLGYLLSTGVGMVGAALATPISPAANRYLGDPTTAGNVPPLGTYALLATAYVALVVGVNAEEIVYVLAPASYADAARIVPWVVLGAVFQTLYLVWSTGTWYSKRTRYVPLVTMLSVALNVGINVLLVPRLGIIVAAVSTLIGYAFAAVLHGGLARINHPIPWEYGRWTKIAVMVIVAYFVVHPLHMAIVPLAVVVKSLAGTSVFVVGLMVLRFWGHDELASVTRRLKRLRA